MSMTRFLLNIFTPIALGATLFALFYFVLGDNAPIKDYHNCAVTSIAMDKQSSDYSDVTTSCGMFYAGQGMSGAAAVGGHYDFQVQNNKLVKVTPPTVGISTGHN